jgi:hypothetical protein
MRNFNKGILRIPSKLTYAIGLKDHVISEKRNSASPPGVQPQQPSRLSRRKRDEENIVTEDNYLHPKKPPARMSMLPFPTEIVTYY